MGDYMGEFIDAVLKLRLGKLFREKTANTYIQFFRYIFVGGFAFLADAVTLWVFELFTHYMIAAAAAFLLGLAVNYALSVLFVFSEAERVKNRAAEFAAYAVIGVIGLALTEAIMYVLTDLCGLYFMLSKVIAAAVVLLWNFIARKKILYKEKSI